MELNVFIGADVDGDECIYVKRDDQYLTGKELEELLPVIEAHFKPADTADSTSPAVISAYRNAAKEASEEGTFEVDDDAQVSIGDDFGAYVEGWLWVSRSEAELCLQCGENSTADGEGYDGMCGTCADKAEGEKAE